MRWFDVEPCYVFHPMNAYDEGDTIVLDVDTPPQDVRYRPPRPARWTADAGPLDLDLAVGKVRESRFDDRGQEFPRIDERLIGKRHPYGYTPSFEDARGTGNLLKHDLVGGDTQQRSFGAEKALGEFVFHPSSDGAAEDDGVLMGYIYDRPTDRSELAILDAQTLQDIASIKLPHRVPTGFHGNSVPSAG